MNAALQMRNDMAVLYSGDTDEDFATSLIAHHKGVVALAQVELHYGTDNKMGQLAEACHRKSHARPPTHRSLPSQARRPRVGFENQLRERTHPTKPKAASDYGDAS